ncbi:MAG: hypothetical protein DRJ69_05905 [Thermoprotei archaeon]|nr:MAG: hypothetical protein DRJ69_05905 [Thermoprotei archaeon]
MIRPKEAITYIGVLLSAIVLIIIIFPDVFIYIILGLLEYIAFKIALYAMGIMEVSTFVRGKSIERRPRDTRGRFVSRTDYAIKAALAVLLMIGFVGWISNIISSYICIFISMLDAFPPLYKVGIAIAVVLGLIIWKYSEAM